MSFPHSVPPPLTDDEEDEGKGGEGPKPAFFKQFHERKSCKFGEGEAMSQGILEVEDVLARQESPGEEDGKDTGKSNAGGC